MISFRCGLSLFLFFTWATSCLAQSEPQFTQFMYNRYLFNPAYAGHDDAVEIAAVHRSQYVALANRLMATQGFNVNLAIDKISSGAGITVINDFVGYQRSTYVALNYAYRKKFKWGKMGIGLGAGLVQTAIQGDKLRAPDGNYDGGVNHNDNFLPNNLQQGIAPDFSFGIYFNNEKYFAGASINHIAFSSAVVRSETSAKSKLNFARNLFFTGGYNFTVSKKFSIMPSALIKTDLNQVQTDVAITTTIINSILAGVSFRGYTKKAIDALGIIVGFRYKGVQLVYSYDANLSYLAKFNSGSHEIGLSYRYPFKKKVSRGYFYHNPRYD